MEYPFRMRKLLFVLLLGLPLLAPAQTTAQKKKVDRAVERCKAQRGVDCDTPEGLREWVLQERSRAEAARDGSRHVVKTPGPR